MKRFRFHFFSISITAIVVKPLATSNDFCATRNCKTNDATIPYSFSTSSLSTLPNCEHFNPRTESPPSNSNPYRSEVLQWYRKLLKAAFEVPWATDEDALYVLSETRRLFRCNQYTIKPDDTEAISRKLREAELRYGLALHYRIPYPRPHNKIQGSSQDSSPAYSPDLDTIYNSTAQNPNIGVLSEGCTGGIPIDSLSSIVNSSKSSCSSSSPQTPLDTSVSAPISTLSRLSGQTDLMFENGENSYDCMNFSTNVNPDRKKS